MTTKLDPRGLEGQTACVKWMAEAANGDRLELELPEPLFSRIGNNLAALLLGQAHSLAKDVEITPVLSP